MGLRHGAEIVVGLLMLAGVAALLFLALRVSGLGQFAASNSYTIKAHFDNIGDLRARAPVTIAGVRVGEVQAINLDKKTYRGLVLLDIDSNIKLPGGTSASIYTQGLLGSNYISLTPGFDDDNPMAANAEIMDTHPAIILENLIGKFMFNKANEKKS